MDEYQIDQIVYKMQPFLSCSQIKMLKLVLADATSENEMSPSPGNTDLLSQFLSAKKLEGCSQRTVEYYRSTLARLEQHVGKSFTRMSTDDLRNYLVQYERERKLCKVTVDTVRRIMSSFFSWLEDEDFIVKSPVRRIHKVRAPKVVRETFSDEHLEKMRDNCANQRDLALIDMLSSTGMRIGELVRLDRGDIDFDERECVVEGKGNKQRRVYFDARTKLHLMQYLESRADNNPALFVSLHAPHTRLKIGSIELRLRNLGRKLGIPHVHPHKFRRTVATSAIDKGMPIEQVQKLLGHARIDTTMHYALVNQNNVKLSHRRYLG